MRLYLDSSAIVKLVQTEAESTALRRYLARHRSDVKVTSELARVEVVRAVLPGGPAALGKARRQIARLHQVAVSRELLDSAATVAPESLLRSLDAIHVTSAQLLGDELRALVTYDLRMVDIARGLGLDTVSPG